MAQVTQDVQFTTLVELKYFLLNRASPRKLKSGSDRESSEVIGRMDSRSGKLTF